MAVVPHLFRCPISLELMRNPVTLCTGITYERESIEKWIREGNLTCPATMQSISSSAELVPNITLQRLIQSFQAGQSRNSIPSERDSFRELDLRQIHKLRELILRGESQGNLVREIQLIRKSVKASTSALTGELCEELGKCMMLVLEFGSREACAEAVIILSCHLQVLGSIRNHQLLIKSVSGIISNPSSSPESRSHSASIVEKLANSDLELKIHLGSDPEVLSGLCTMLYQKNSARPALGAIHSLLGIRRIRSKLVAAGAVRAIIELLPELDQSRSGTELGLCILELLCRSAEGRAEFASHELGMFAVCKKMFRVSSEATGFAVGILWSLCRYSSDESVKRRAVDASAFERLLLLLHVDCSPATRQQVYDLLKLLRQVYNEEPCIIASPDQALPAAVVPIYPRC